MTSNVTIPDSNVSLLIPYDRTDLPLAWEQIDIERMPDHLSGRCGKNREQFRTCQLAAQTDLEAIETWLKENQNKQTYRSYRSAVERFAAWCYLLLQQPVSSITREDMLQYHQFLQNPQPAETWCAPHYTLRGSPNWRPFEGPLAEGSRKQTMTVLAALFSYLVDNAYLSGNPMRRWGKHVDASKKESNQAVAKNNYLDKAELNLLYGALEKEADRIQADDPRGLRLKSKYERWLFVIRFLVNTGMRRDELAGATIGSIQYETHAVSNHSEWFMMVLGKGSKHRKIVLTPTAMRAWERYLAHHHHFSFPMGLKCPILLSVWGTAESNMTGQVVYSIAKEALVFGAEALTNTHPTVAAKLLRATPHWLRRSFATIASQYKIPIEHVQKQLGHTSIETTAIYMKDDPFERSAAFRNMEA